MSTGSLAMFSCLAVAAGSALGLACWAELRREWAAYLERRLQSAPDGHADLEDQASSEFLAGDYDRTDQRGDE